MLAISHLYLDGFNDNYNAHFNLIQCKPDISRLVGSKQWYRDFEWERDISGVCHEPKSGSIFQRVVSKNGSFVCLAANSARRQRI